MAPNATSFHEENEDHPTFESNRPEPIRFLRATVSTLSINDLPFQSGFSKKNSWFNRFSGTLYALTASLLFTCAAFSIKRLGVDIMDALLFRLFIQTLMTFGFALYKDYPLIPGNANQIVLQILCCATGAGGFFFYFIAIRYVELSDVTTLSYTRIVWTVVFTIIFYRERPRLALLVALPLTLLGVVFVTQPGLFFASKLPSMVSVSRELRLLGLTLSIVGAFTSAATVLLYKRLVSTSKEVKPSVLNFQYCLAVLIILILNLSYKTYVLQKGLSFDYVTSWPFLAGSAICLVMMISNLLTQKAIKREHPAVFTLLGSSDIIFSLILQNLFTTNRSNFYALLGSGLVISSVAIIGISKFFEERYEQKSLPLLDQHTVVNEKSAN